MVDYLQLTVKFIEGLSVPEVVATINQLTFPQVILWYIGCKGLREAGVQFYRDSLIAPLIKNKNDATFWLVDLTAWSAFKNTKCSIYHFSRIADLIETIPNSRIKCIKSAKIFAKMQETSETELINYFKKALRRNFISQASQQFFKSHIRLGDIFSNNCPIFADWYDEDTNECYSTLQYLEGFFLVEEVLTQQALKSDDLQIIFALPNDELKYYKDSQDSFQKDLRLFISKRCSDLNLKTHRIMVIFLSFRYGSACNERPYNAPGKILKLNDLSCRDIIGH